eukprot:15063909-Alexandrium_andersonii.AAC.1
MMRPRSSPKFWRGLRSGPRITNEFCPARVQGHRPVCWTNASAIQPRQCATPRRAASACTSRQA